MDKNFDEYKLKQMLVDLKLKKERLQSTIDHLKNEIEKREILIDELKNERELELINNNKAKLSSKQSSCSNDNIDQLLTQNQRVTGFESLFDGEFSSEFSEQVALLLDNITKTTEEISASIRL